MLGNSGFKDFRQRSWTCGGGILTRTQGVRRNWLQAETLNPKPITVVSIFFSIIPILPLCVGLTKQPEH